MSLYRGIRDNGGSALRRAALAKPWNPKWAHLERGGLREAGHLRRQREQAALGAHQVVGAQHQQRRAAGGPPARRAGGRRRRRPDRQRRRGPQVALHSAPEQARVSPLACAPPTKPTLGGHTRRARACTVHSCGTCALSGAGSGALPGWQGAAAGAARRPRRRGALRGWAARSRARSTRRAGGPGSGAARRARRAPAACPPPGSAAAPAAAPAPAGGPGRAPRRQRGPGPAEARREAGG